MHKENSTKLMPVLVPPTLYKQFKQLCDQQYRSVSSVVKELMIKFLEEQSK